MKCRIFILGTTFFEGRTAPMYWWIWAHRRNLILIKESNAFGWVSSKYFNSLQILQIIWEAVYLVNNIIITLHNHIFRKLGKTQTIFSKLFNFRLFFCTSNPWTSSQIFGLFCPVAIHLDSSWAELGSVRGHRIRFGSRSSWFSSGVRVGLVGLGLVGWLG